MTQEQSDRTPDTPYPSAVIIMELMAAKQKKPPTKLQLAVAPRLKAIQDELGKTADAMAEYVGADGGRTRWANWIGAANLPKEECMISLCEKTGVTLDWIYRGSSAGMEMALAIRLHARVQGVDPTTAGAPAMRKLAQELAEEVFPLSEEQILEAGSVAKRTHVSKT